VVAEIWNESEKNGGKRIFLETHKRINNNVAIKIKELNSLFLDTNKIQQP